jgi:hypothetical protein
MMEAMCDTLCANLGTVLATLVVGYISYFLYGYAKVTPFDAPFISVPVPKGMRKGTNHEYLPNWFNTAMPFLSAKFML